MRVSAVHHACPCVSVFRVTVVGVPLGRVTRNVTAAPETGAPAALRTPMPTPCTAPVSTAHQFGSTLLTCSTPADWASAFPAPGAAENVHVAASAARNRNA